MTDAPLLSYIVLSYNYERYIGQTIRSILTQTVQDFEIVVVDDASSDGSREVVQGFSDPRIRLLVNDCNMGGAWSYNRAVEAARGRWLVNLDADDWVEPEKAALQLQAAEVDPALDIIGTQISLVDGAGSPHPQAAALEPNYDDGADLNVLDTWIGRNPLARSSTMIRRETHLRIGLDDASMVRAPDYELWTRALREGCRFAVVPRRLTALRLQSTGVTVGDPVGTLLEVTYAMMRNLVPLAEERAMLPSVRLIIECVVGHPQLGALRPIEAYRLVGTMMMGMPQVRDFAAFRQFLSDPAGDHALERYGRRYLAIFRAGQEARLKLLRDVDAYIEAREYWHRRADTAQEELAAAGEELARLRSVCSSWEQAYRRTMRWRLGQLARRAYSRFTRSS